MSMLREHHWGHRRTQGRTGHGGAGMLLHATASLHPRAWYLLSGSKSHVHLWGEWPVRKTVQLGEEEWVRASEDIQGQWGKWESVEGMCGASRGRRGR